MRTNTLKWAIPTLLSIMLTFGPACADDKPAEKKQPQGPPPMLVAVAPIVTGSAEPMIELVGTIRYARVSRVAGEISGIVDRVNFDAGTPVTAGQVLVNLNTDLLTTRIAATRASHEQLLLQLELARKDLARITALNDQGSIAEVIYDEQYYRTMGLERQAAAMQATLDRQLLEEKKTTIRAPFAGVVMEKMTEKGEWVAASTPVATVADDSEVDVVIDAPQQLLNYLRSGRTIAVRAAGSQLKGRFVHFVPRGDVATRTFEVKIRLKNTVGLVEGMEAHALLPNGTPTDGLLLPRDAVIKQRGQDVCFIVVEGTAKMISVTISGYQGMQVAVTGAGLEVGQQVVIKGNERIRNGQAVRLDQ